MTLNANEFSGAVQQQLSLCFYSFSQAQSPIVNNRCNKADIHRSMKFYVDRKIKICLSAKNRRTYYNLDAEKNEISHCARTAK